MLAMLAMLATQDAALPLKLHQLEQVVVFVVPLSDIEVLEHVGTLVAVECEVQFWRLWQPAVQQLVGERFQAGMTEEYGLQFVMKSRSQAQMGKSLHSGSLCEACFLIGQLHGTGVDFSLNPSLVQITTCGRVVYSRPGLRMLAPSCVWPYPAQNT